MKHQGEFASDMKAVFFAFCVLITAGLFVFGPDLAGPLAVGLVAIVSIAVLGVLVIGGMSAFLRIWEDGSRLARRKQARQRVNAKRAWEEGVYGKPYACVDQASGECFPDLDMRNPDKAWETLHDPDSSCYKNGNWFSKEEESINAMYARQAQWEAEKE